MKRSQLAEKKSHSAKRQAKSYTAKPHKDYGTQYGPRTNQAIQKFTAHNNGHLNQTKTIDNVFQGAYSGTYTVDTQPLQQLMCNAATATVQALNNIQANPGEASRFSNKISMKSLRVRLSLAPTGVVAARPSNQPFFQRVLVVYDRNTNGAYPAANLVLSDMISTNVVNNGSPWSNLNPSFFDRMVVLMDESIMLPPFSTPALLNADGPTENKNWVIDRFVKLKDLETMYNGTANPPVIANIQTGGLYIVAFGNAVTGTNDSWQLQGTCRLRFRDN